MFSDQPESPVYSVCKMLICTSDSVCLPSGGGYSNYFMFYAAKIDLQINTHIHLKKKKCVAEIHKEENILSII